MRLRSAAGRCGLMAGPLLREGCPCLMAIYKLYGPEKAMLGMEAVRELLGGITSRQVRALIASGHFPRPIRAGGKGPPHWSGLTIAAWQHLSPMMAVGEVEIGEDDE